MFACLFSTIGVFRGTANIAIFESSYIGLQNSNYEQLYKNVRVKGCVEMMFVSCVVFTLLGVYLDQVLPGGYGQKKKWNFIFSPSYWFSTNITKKIYK